MKGLKRIMLITSVFPPSWGSGVHRISKLYKYLADFGYFPIVLTTKEESYGVIDPSIHRSVKQGLVMRSYVMNWWTLSKRLGMRPKSKPFALQTRERKNRFKKFISHFLKNIYEMISIPDDRSLWIPLAVIQGYWAIRKYRIGLLYSTSPHHSSHMVALLLNRLTGLPWIADFRDPWAGNPFRSDQPQLHQFFDHFLEKKVVKYSSKIISISEPITENFRKRYPEIPLKKFGVLPNSFDPEDFLDLQETSSFTNKFLISHAGTFYGNRSPESFLLALRKLLEQKPRWKEMIEVFFIGPLPPNNRESIVFNNSLRDVIKFIPYQPYKEMLKFLKNSALLLLIPGPGEGTITSKVFDYLGLKKPIFLLSQGNIALENILRRTKSGFIVPHDDIHKIAESLSKAVQIFLDNGDLKLEIDEEEIKHFTSIEMTKKLSRIMEELQSRERGIFRT